MTPPLSERETRMLRKLALKHGCSFGGIKPLREAMSALSELLLAAKEKAAQQAYDMQRVEGRSEIGNEIRNSDWGDLFEEKV